MAVTSFQEWMKTVPEEFTKDPLWTVEAYRLGLFAVDLSWHDVTALVRDARTRSLSDQLYRAVGSIAANISEGYSRGTGKDRARFYEYALGSARESRGWYYAGRHVLSEEIGRHRLGLLTQIIRLLLKMIPQQRSYTLHEDRQTYLSMSEEPLIEEELLIHVPLQ